MIVVADTTPLLTLFKIGRMDVESMKLTITGSIGILFAAYQKKLLTADEIDQSVTMLRGMNRFISERLFNLLLSWSTIKNRVLPFLFFLKNSHSPETLD